MLLSYQDLFFCQRSDPHLLQLQMLLGNKVHSLNLLLNVLLQKVPVGAPKHREDEKRLIRCMLTMYSRRVCNLSVHWLSRNASLSLIQTFYSIHLIESTRKTCSFRRNIPCQDNFWQHPSREPQMQPGITSNQLASIWLLSLCSLQVLKHFCSYIHHLCPYFNKTIKIY